MCIRDRSDPEAPANEGLMIGTLQIEDDCVYVQPEGGGDRVFVVFGSAKTSWDPDTKSVLSKDGRGTFRPYVNGDRVEIGGGGLAQSSLQNFDWVVEPDSTCDTTRLWIASTIS